MDVIDPGHHYKLREFDGVSIPEEIAELFFIKREGEHYPGNTGHHGGTTTQEVLRALIDRTIYVDNQIHDNANNRVLFHLRSAIYELEDRAARRHQRELSVNVKWLVHSSATNPGIEDKEVCDKCGHIGCKGECRE